MAPSVSLVWFRRDLRLHNQAALAAAWQRGGAIVPVYIDDAAVPEGGAASRWWLHHSLMALAISLAARGARLVVRRGPAAVVLEQVAREVGAEAVYWQRGYEPAQCVQEQAVVQRLSAVGISAQALPGGLWFDPETVRNRQGKPFQVFTPFWRHLQTLPFPSLPSIPEQGWPVPRRWPASEPLAALALLPKRNWAQTWLRFWTPGEVGARQQLTAFLQKGLPAYAEARERPGESGTSRLSPHLHFGEIDPRQIWAELRARAAGTGVFPRSVHEQTFLRELAWREFSAHLLYHFPHTVDCPLRPEWADFPWAEENAQARAQRQAWQRGRTGYPIVDAGMRELWATGWMHNRVRMLVASFLVKHLRQTWTHGAAWFADTLVDADMANNTMGWQWSAGCGADAAPYFRIFNPALQGQRFDPAGAYVRRWVPELSRLPDRHLHAPWAAPANVLATAGVTLGKNYPAPLVDPGSARTAALDAFHVFRQRQRP